MIFVTISNRHNLISKNDNKGRELLDTNLKRNIIWNIIGTTLNGFNSLFYMIIITRINGLQDAGLFSFAFSLACLFFIIGTYAGKVYQVTDIHEQYNDREYIIHKAITCAIMLSISVLYIGCMQFTRDKVIIIFLWCIMKTIEAFSEVFLAILQKYGNLYQAGISLTIKTILSLLLFITVDILFKNTMYAIITTNIVWIIIILIYDLPKVKKVYHSSPVDWTKIMGLFKTGFYTFSVQFLTIYITNGTKYAMGDITSRESQAIYGYIIMPATIVGLCAQYILQPFLQNISIAYKDEIIEVGVSIPTEIKQIGHFHSAFATSSYLSIP